MFPVWMWSPLHRRGIDLYAPLYWELRGTETLKRMWRRLTSYRLARLALFMDAD